MPANTTTTVAVPATIVSSPPWPGLDLGLRFTVTPVGSDRLQIVTAPSPVIDGVRGVHIALGSDPAGAPGRCPFTPTVVAPDAAITFTGSAPAVPAGQLMTLRAVATPGAAPVELARVPVGADGSFTCRWHPPAPGDYTVGALYTSQSPDLADDFSRALNFRVPAPAATPTPTVVEETRGWHRPARPTRLRPGSRSVRAHPRLRYRAPVS